MVTEQFFLFRSVSALWLNIYWAKLAQQCCMHQSSTIKGSHGLQQNKADFAPYQWWLFQVNAFLNWIQIVLERATIVRMMTIDDSLMRPLD